MFEIYTEYFFKMMISISWYKALRNSDVSTNFIFDQVKQIKNYIVKKNSIKKL